MTCFETLSGAKPFAIGEHLQLLYQPIVDLRSFTISAVEALIRWNGPQGRMLRPDAFLPSLLRSRHRAPVTSWTFRTAADQLAVWYSMGFTKLRMCVNVSLQDLLDGSLPACARDAADAAGVPREQMEIEIPERGAVTEASRAMATIRRLRSDGFRIAVDDFGAGSASLRYLLDIPASTIKLDRSFVAGTPRWRDTTVLERACDLASRLGFEVVVEGIENADQLGLTLAFSASFGQGHYLGHPQRADAIGECLV